MKQQNLFDKAHAERLKREGMDTAAENRPDALEAARAVARELGRKARLLGKGITSDHVFKECARRGLPSCIGPAAGSLFRTADWVTRNQWQKSVRTSNHSRMLRVWFFIGE